jgi:hypothetical protein
MARKQVLAGAVVVAALVATAGLSMVWADVATPRPRWTMVRMESETVSITLGEKRVGVEAVFTMYNEGKTGPVRMGYPLGLFETELHDFAVAVNDQAVQSIRTEEGKPADESPMGRMRGGNEADESYRFEGPYKQWKVWDVDMEANAPRTVKVTYWVEPAALKDAEKGDLLHYSYTLKTGATWKGKINLATIKVTLDGVAPQNIVRQVPVGAVASAEGKVLTWTLRQFKPTEDVALTFRPATAAKVAAR